MCTIDGVALFANTVNYFSKMLENLDTGFNLIKVLHLQLTILSK